MEQLVPHRMDFHKIWHSCVFPKSVEKIKIWLKSDKVQGKGFPQQAEVAEGVPGRLRPRIFLTFGTTKVVGRQPYTPAAFTPGEVPGTNF